MSSMQSHWRKICQIGYQKLISIKKKKKKKKKKNSNVRSDFFLGEEANSYTGHLEALRGI